MTKKIVIKAVSFLLLFLTLCLRVESNSGINPTEIKQLSNYYVQRGMATATSSEQIFWFNKAIKIDNTNYIAYIQRGNAYTKLKLYNNAISDYSKFIQLKPNEVAGYLSRGNCYLYTYNYSMALNDYNKAVALSPNDYELLYIRATIYFDYANAMYGENNYNLDFYDKAFVDLNNVIKINPQYYPAYEIRGKINLIYQKPDDFDRDITMWGILKNTKEYNQKFDLEKEIQTTTEEIKKSPNDFTNYYYRGLCYFLINKKAEAKKDFLKTLSINSNNSNAYLWIIRTEISLKNYIQSIEYLNSELSKNINNPDIEERFFYLRGYCYHQLGNYKKAEEDYLKALAIEPNSIATVEALRKLKKDTNKI